MNTHAQTGRIRLIHLFYLGLSALVLYVASQLSSFWISAYQLENFMDEKVRTAQLVSDEELRSSIEIKAVELGIPAPELAIRIDRSEKAVIVTADWTRTYDFWGLYQYQAAFSKRAAVNY